MKIFKISAPLVISLLCLATWASNSEDHPQDHKKKHAPKHKTAHRKAHWTYKGDTGPSHWGSLNSKFRLCSKGYHQSPINLKWSRPVLGGNIRTHFKMSPLDIVNNGHTVQVNFKRGMFTMIRGKRFELLQLHFHSLSEHTIANKHSPMEMHLVHKSTDGNLGVLGVMLKEGKMNNAIETIWSNIPKEINEPLKLSKVYLNPADLLPKKKTYYNYTGSLTTPPCSEGVNWNVFNTPIELSRLQPKRFRSFYTDTHRPIQPINDRRPTNY